MLSLSEKKIKCSFVVLGNNHADHEPFHALAKIIEELHINKVPCIFMEEVPSDQGIDEQIKLSKQGISEGEAAKSILPKELYEKDSKSKKLYLKASEKNTVKETLKRYLPLSEGHLNQALLEVYRERAYEESIVFYKKLKELGIPFFGVELSSNVFSQKVTSGGNSLESFCKNEMERITNMVGNITSSVKNFQNQDMIVFVFVGNIHAHRLAVNLQLELSKDSQVDAKVLACKLESKDWMEVSTSVNSIEEGMRKNVDSLEVQNAYKSFPCPVFYNENQSSYYLGLKTLVGSSLKNKDIEKYSGMFFSSSPHEKLLNEINEYSQMNSLGETLKVTFIPAIIKKDYSLGLRIACAIGETNLIKILISYCDRLAIDFEAKSSNGNTAVMWLENSKASEFDKKEIINLLEKNISKEFLVRTSYSSG